MEADPEKGISYYWVKGKTWEEENKKWKRITKGQFVNVGYLCSFTNLSPFFFPTTVKCTVFLCFETGQFGRRQTGAPPL